ncbi:hypothetical protein [Shewanella zhangzhouensis]|nr:hypothetical protein [Shewanella zhangzhouensis]
MKHTANDLQIMRLVREAHQYLNEMNRLLAAVEQRLVEKHQQAA